MYVFTLQQRAVLTHIQVSSNKRKILNNTEQCHTYEKQKQTEQILKSNRKNNLKVVLNGFHVNRTPQITLKKEKKEMGIYFLPFRISL